MDGQPLPDAMVIFTPPSGGRPAADKTDAQGRYELVFSRDAAGAVIGDQVVTISTFEELFGDDGTISAKPETVPAKYNQNTELTAKVEAGSNTIDFDLDSEGEVVQPEG